MSLSFFQRRMGAGAAHPRPGAMALGLVLLWAGGGPLPGAEAPGKTEVSQAQTNRPAQPAGGPGGGPLWKEYRHPTGLRLTYPPDWQLRPMPSGLLLIPPDPGSNAGGLAEVYLVAADSAEGVTNIEDPRVLAYLDLQVSRLAPFLQRSGPGEKIPCATAPGLLAQWEGKNFQGLPVQAQGFATILKGYGVVLFALGEQARIKNRDTTLRKIFSSFAAGEGQKNPQLVGKWQFWSYTSTADGAFGTERSRVMALKADGTCTWFSRSESSGTFKEKDSLGDSKWVAGVAGTGSDADTGAWSAGDGKLFIQWKDGSIGQWDYTISGVPGNRRLFLKGNQNKPDEWVEAR